MGEAQNESQNCFPETFYSARLLWKVLSQTKVIVSVLKAEKGVRRRVSVRTRRTRDWVDNNGYIPDEKANWEEKKNKRKVAKTSCYLCKLHQNNISKSTLHLPYSYAPQTLRSPSSQENITYLPITRSQPPAPPRRSTSLPYYKILKELKRLQVITGPHYQLPDFRLLDVEDGWIWRDVVQIGGRDEIWGLILQVCHEDSGIRHLVLGIEFPYKKMAGKVAIHCFQALKRLRSFQSTIRDGANADSRGWEFSFLSVYLFAYLNTLLGNKKAMRYWMRIGYRILRRAFRYFKVDVEGDGKGLPGSMREVALAFGKLDSGVRNRK